MTDLRDPLAGYHHAFEPGTSDWTLLLLHGTGGDEHDLLPLGRQLAPGANLLSPRGTVLEGGTTNRFFARRGANDIDVDDMLERTDELAGFIAEAIATYDLDPGHIVALGYSNGANIALSMLMRHPAVLRGAALLRPVLYHEPEPVPSLRGVDVFAAAGAHDPYTPPDVVEQLRRVLDTAGATAEIHVDQSAGHGLVQADLARTAAWLDRLLTPSGG